MSFPQGLDGFRLGALGVLHHHLDVVRADSIFIQIFCFFGFRHFILDGHLCLGLFRLLNSFSFGVDWFVILVDLALTGLHAIEIGFTEDDVGVLVSGRFPDIWVIDADDELR